MPEVVQSRRSLTNLLRVSTQGLRGLRLVFNDNEFWRSSEFARLHFPPFLINLLVHCFSPVNIAVKRNWTAFGRKLITELNERKTQRDNAESNQTKKFHFVNNVIIMIFHRYLISVLFIYASLYLLIRIINFYFMCHLFCVSLFIYRRIFQMFKSLRDYILCNYKQNHNKCIYISNEYTCEQACIFQNYHMWIRKRHQKDNKYILYILFNLYICKVFI